MSFGKRWAVVVAVAAVALSLLVSACGSSGSKESSGSAKESSGSGEAAASSGGSSESGSELAAFQKVVEEARAKVTAWPAGAPTESVTPPANKLIVNIPCSTAEPGCMAIVEGEREAAKVLGWQIKVISGEFSAAKTKAAFEQAIALHADAIVTEGAEAIDYKDVIKKAHEAGIPVVTTFSDTAPSPELAQAEVDDSASEQGRFAAAAAVVNAKGKGEFALFGFPEYKELRERMESVKTELEKCKECKIAAEYSIHSSEAQKTLPAATSSAVTKDPNLSGIITGIDTFANMQVPVLKSVSSSVPVYTFLGLQPTLVNIQKGNVAGVIGMPLHWAGWAALDDVARLLTKKKPAASHYLPVKLIEKSDVASRALGTGYGWDGDGFNYKAEYEKLWGK